MKIGESCYFLRCTNHYNKNKNHKAQEQNKSLKSDYKEMEIYKLLIKVFKISIVNKFNALQKNTNAMKQNLEKGA